MNDDTTMDILMYCEKLAQGDYRKKHYYLVSYFTRNSVGFTDSRKTRLSSIT